MEQRQLELEAGRSQRLPRLNGSLRGTWGSTAGRVATSARPIDASMVGTRCARTEGTSRNVTRRSSAEGSSRGRDAAVIVDVMSFSATGAMRWLSSSSWDLERVRAGESARRLDWQSAADLSLANLFVLALVLAEVEPKRQSEGDVCNADGAGEAKEESAANHV